MKDGPIKDLEPNAESPLYSSIVFGHNPRDLDPDQITGFCVGRFSGLIDTSALAICTNIPTDEAVNDPTIMIIEGVPKDSKHTINDLKTGNFDTGKDDTCVAMEIKQKALEYRRANKLPQLDHADEFNGFIRWFNQNEKFGNSSIPKELGHMSDAMQSWNRVLHGIKLTSHNLDEILSRSYAAFETLLLHPDTFVDLYTDELKNLDEINTISTDHLRSVLAQEPHRLQTTKTMSNITFTTIDIRGCGVDKGGMGYAITQTNPDLVLLIDDAYEDDGTTISGVQFKLKSTNPDNPINVQELFAERLSLMEQLVGSGYEIVAKSDFDGHPGIIGSPRTGSEIQPDLLRHAITQFLDSPHWSTKQWKDETNALAATCELVTFIAPEAFTEHSPIALPERELIIALPPSKSSLGQHKLISIRESDVLLYKNAINALKRAGKGSKDIRDWLSKVSVATEPEEIHALRREKAEDLLIRSIDSQDAIRALDALDQFSSRDISSLDPDIALRIIQIISADTQAIQHVTDPDDITYNLDTSQLPDWAKNDPEIHRIMRFSATSVQYKFNSILLPLLIRKSRESTDFADSTAKVLSHIIEQRVYQQVSNPLYPDKILDSYIQILGSDRVTLSAHTRGAAELNLSKVIPMLTKRLQTSGVRVSEDYVALRQTIHSLPEIEISPIPMELTHGHLQHVAIREIIERQRAAQKPVILPILIAIGRPIDQLIHESLINCADKSIQTPIDEPFAIELRHENKQLENPITQSSPIAEVLYNEIKQIIDVIPADGKLWIIRGGFPNFLTHRVVQWLSLLPKEIQEKISFIDYNQFNSQFYESPFLDYRMPQTQALS